MWSTLGQGTDWSQQFAVNFIMGLWGERVGVWKNNIVSIYWAHNIFNVQFLFDEKFEIEYSWLVAKVICGFYFEKYFYKSILTYENSE